MYNDPLARRLFIYATSISCDKNPQIIKTLDPASDVHFALTTRPVLRATPTLFETNQFQPATNLNTFTAQKAGNCSNAESTDFRNRVLFTKHSDTTLKLLGKALSYDFLATAEQHPTDSDSSPYRNRFNHFNVLRVGLHDHLLNLAPLFVLDFFADAFVAKFGFPCLVFTQCGVNFFTFL